MTDRPQVSRGRGRPKGRDLGDVGRRGIIDAAKSIFATEDPAKINRRIFAEKAGVDPNLIRYYFGDMRKLMVALLADTHNEARSQMLGLKEDHDPEERLRFRVERTFHLFRSQPNHHQMVRTVIYDSPDSKDHKDWEALLHDTVADLEDILAEGVERGQMRGGVDAAALHLLIIGACEFWTTNGPVIAILFPKKKSGAALDRFFIKFLQDRIAESLRPTPDGGGQVSST